MYKKINRNSISLAGEFAVLSQLALRNYDANMTLGNTKSVDILVSDPTNNNMYKLEVKTRFGPNESNEKLFGKTIGWIMDKKHEEIKDPNLFYAFVHIDNKEANGFRFFIVPSAVVAKYVMEQHDYWLKQGTRPHKDSNMRKFRIGTEETGYAVPTALASKYENNWEFKS